MKMSRWFPLLPALSVPPPRRPSHACCSPGPASFRWEPAGSGTSDRGAGVCAHPSRVRLDRTNAADAAATVRSWLAGLSRRGPRSASTLRDRVRAKPLWSTPLERRFVWRSPHVRLSKPPLGSRQPPTRKDGPTCPTACSGSGSWSWPQPRSVESRAIEFVE